VRIDVYLPIVISVLLALLARPVGHRLPPRLAVQLLVPAAVVTAAGWIWVLALLCWTAVGRLSFVAAAGHWSPAALGGANDPVAGPIAYLAGTSLLVLSAVIVTVTIRRARAVWATRALARQICPVGDGELVVIDQDAPEAFAVPGTATGRIVVSTGMLRALDAGERRVVFAHERAHLHGRHHWWLLAAQLAAAADPVLTRLPSLVSHLLERWADETAAEQVGDRRLAARALARAALATLNRPAPIRNIGVALSYTTRGVPARVQALLTDPPSIRWPLILVIAALTTVAAAGAIDAGRDLENLFEHAMHAYWARGS
jgi:Zn-dependent protease with chaperone function